MEGDAYFLDNDENGEDTSSSYSENEEDNSGGYSNYDDEEEVLEDEECEDNGGTSYFDEEFEDDELEEVVEIFGELSDSEKRLDNFFEPSSITNMREAYHGRSKDLASQILSNEFRIEDGRRIMMGCVTFTGGNVFNRKVRIKNNVSGGIMDCKSHTVVLLGEYIMDVLCQNQLIRTSAYIDMLKTLNPSVAIKKLETFWYSADGYEYTPTISELYEYTHIEV